MRYVRYSALRCAKYIDKPIGGYMDIGVREKEQSQFTFCVASYSHNIVVFKFAKPLFSLRKQGG